MEQLAKIYTKQTGVQVDVWGTTGDSYAQQLQTKLASNQGPTIMSISPGTLPGSEADKLKSYLYDMSDQSYVKDIAPNMALKIIDRAIQAFGAAGVSEDTPLAASWANIRTLRLADGPDEVHKRAIARYELKKYR